MLARKPKSFDEFLQLMQAEYTDLLSEKKKAYGQYHSAKKEMQDILTAKANIDRLLGVEQEQKAQEQQWFGVEHCKTPGLLRDALLKSYHDFSEQQLTHNRRSLTADEIADIESRCRQLYDRCEE